MRRLKIATLHSDRAGSFLARCQTPLGWLQGQGAIETIPAIKAWEADIAVLHSQWQPASLAVVQSLRQHGVRVVVDIDVDIFDTPRDHPAAHICRDPAFQKRVRDLSGAADAVFVPTAHLAGKLASLNSKV